MSSIRTRIVKNDIKKNGFTLIELIIVIAIIGVLSVIALPKFSGILKDAKVKADISSAKVITDATYAQIAKGAIIPVTAGTTVLIGDSANAVSGIITDYIQNVPHPKSTSTANFTVVINAVGDVIVKDGINQVYPILNAE